MLPACCRACGSGAASAAWLHRDTALPAGWLQHLPCITGYLCLPLQGVKNNLAMKHVPWVLPRNDTLAGGCQPAVQALHSAAGRHFEQPLPLLAIHPTNSPRCCAGPRGRRGDQVGGFTLMNVADLRRVAPLWLKYTEDVRFDPDVSCVA